MNRRMLACILLPVLGACTAMSGAGGGPSAPAPELLAYGDGPQQFGELRLPAGAGPFPLAVIIHGGCWQRSIADYRFMDGFASALTARGWATWNIEYRGVDDAGGGWPNTFLDVAAAIDHVRTLAARRPLDLQRLALIGHSAGGHLALWAASRPQLPAGSVLRSASPLLPGRVVGLAAITDLQTYRSEGGGCASAISALSGESASTPERLRESSPLHMLPPAGSTTLITAAGDFIVPAAQAQRYVDAAAGRVDRVEVEGDHFSVIATAGAGWTALLQALGMP